MSMVSSITPALLKQWLAEGREVVLIDVRKEPAWRDSAIRLPNARRGPPEAVDSWAPHLTESAPIVCYCVHGHEVSQGATAALKARDMDAYYLEGGIERWHELGFPTVRRDD